MSHNFLETILNLVKNKRAVPLAAVAALFLSAIFTAMYINASSKKELNRALEQQREMTVLTGEFLQIKKRVESIEIRKDLKKIDGIVHAIDEVFAPIGLKGKIKSVKPSASIDRKDATEEAAVVEMERLNMNETVNVLYRINSVPFILTVKKSSIKTTFDNPELLNLTLTLSLVRQK